MKQILLIFKTTIIIITVSANAQDTPPLLSSIFKDVRNQLIIEAPHVQYIDTFSCEMNHKGYAPHSICSIDITGIEAHLDFGDNHETIVNAFTDQLIKNASNEWAIDLYQLCYIQTDSTSKAVMFMDYIHPFTTKRMLTDFHGMTEQEASAEINHRLVEEISNQINIQMPGSGSFDTELVELMAFNTQDDAIHHPDFSCFDGILPAFCQRHSFRDYNYSVDDLAKSIAEQTLQFEKHPFPDLSNSLCTEEFRYAVTVDEISKDQFIIKTLLCPIRSKITLD